MCGICGKVSFNGGEIHADILERMMSVMVHRGPDGDGTYLYRKGGVSAGFGHRRLSIIDLSDAGRQPMSNEDGTVWVVFNGEIYNFPVLRTELERLGHRFRSRTDTEVIVHLYEERGIDGIRDLAGMFAFALWDAKTETLILCRDRIGIKPLLYFKNGPSLVFASEIHAILEDPDVAKEMDWDAFELYLTFNYIPAPYTIFRNVRKLEPAHMLIFRQNEILDREYWNVGLHSAADPPPRFSDLKKVLYHALDEAVKEHMVSDVPLGAFLSGGLDSSIVVGLMNRNAGRPISTYTIGYDDMPLYDETGYARDVAALNQTDHHEIRLSASDVLSVVPRILDSFDEPFADSSAIPTFIVSRETAGSVKVALSGDGGDELFAGYRMYAGEYWRQKYVRIPSFLRQRLVEPLVEILPDSRDRLMTDYVRRMKKFLRGTDESFDGRFFAWNEIFSKDLRKDILLKAGPADHDAGKRRLAARLGETEFDCINRMLYADLKESLPGDMLRKVDAMSMLNSLEVRVPLLDHRVCELAFSMAGDLKMRRGRGKYIFTETFREILPASVLKRPKRGFEMPLSIWLKEDLAYLIEEYLSRDTIRRQGLFDFDVVKGLIARLASGRSDTSWHLWNLIVFQNWYFRHMGNRGRS